MTGHVYGTAGVGVSSGKWVQNRGVARAGAAGERLTAQLLDRLAAESDVTVLHDLRIPVPRFSANIDHAVVSGRDVWLIDSKMWAPGFLWTFAGRTRRGTVPFPAADKHTMELAYTGVARYLTGRGAQIHKPIVTIWSTSGEPTATWALRVPGARAVAGAKLLAHLPESGAEADSVIVAQLQRLMNMPKAT